LFCPTKTAVKNLENENILESVFNVGDVMYDAVENNLKLAKDKSEILEKEKLISKEYYLITVHRAENTDDFAKMKNVIDAFTQIKGDKVWPIHPRTRKVIEDQGFDLKEVPGLHVIDPVGYLDMLTLEQNARK
ncbi:UDP-N-acetylglucosamine 2-epimerase, partial [Staphylococcus sp. SIMBA_130]